MLIVGEMTGGGAAFLPSMMTKAGNDNYTLFLLFFVCRMVWYWCDPSGRYYIFVYGRAVGKLLDNGLIIYKTNYSN
jgi:hypothetical protein